MFLRTLFGALAVFCAASPVLSEGEITDYSEYSATVVRVVDGDTLDLEIALWPGLTGTYAVRVRGIDAPETHRPNCEKERVLGEKAKAQVARLYDVGSTVRLENVTPDSFGGRVVADLSRWRSDRWLYLSEELLDRDLAKQWKPSMGAIDWCAK